VAGLVLSGRADIYDDRRGTVFDRLRQALIRNRRGHAADQTQQYRPEDGEAPLDSRL
jgi:hypothetical protein